MLAMSALPKIHWGYEGPVPMCPALLRTKGRKHKLGRTGSQYRDTGENEARRDNFNPSLPKQSILSSVRQKPRGTIDPGKDRKLVSDDRVAFAHYKAVIMAREGNHENTNEKEGDSLYNGSPVEVIIWKDDKVLILSKNSCPENEHELFWWKEEYALEVTRDEGVALYSKVGSDRDYVGHFGNPPEGLKGVYMYENDTRVSILEATTESCCY